MADDCAYKEGDQDYNIWFDKFLTDANIKDREVNFILQKLKKISIFFIQNLYKKFKNKLFIIYKIFEKLKYFKAAPTRCDPDFDSGFTVGDLKDHTFFCIHFSRGCCSLGHNCNYKHHIPSIKECDTIDQSLDVFGRTRYARFRDDMQGIGNFLKETRTICVTDFLLPLGDNIVTILYETLWRFFSLFGEIDVKKLLINKFQKILQIFKLNKIFLNYF